MAITWIGTGTPQSVAGAGDATVPWPAHIKDDIGLLVCESEEAEAVTVTTANGFAQVTGSPNAGSGMSARLTLYWCRATSASMASPLVHSTNHINAAIIVFRGVKKTGEPIEAYTENTDANAYTLVIPGGTTTRGYEMVVGLVATTNVIADGNYSSWANASLSSITEFLDQGNANGDNGGIAAAGGILQSAGASGNITATGPARTASVTSLALMEETAAGNPAPISPYFML